MPDDDQKPTENNERKDELLYPDTAEEDAGTEPGVMGASSDEELEGDESAAEEARRAAYGDHPPDEAEDASS